MGLSSGECGIFQNNIRKRERVDSIEKIDPSKIPKIFAGVLHTGKIKQVAVGVVIQLKVRVYPRKKCSLICTVMLKTSFISCVT